MNEPCSLCLAIDTRLRARAHGREYWQCGQCALVFVPAQFHISAVEERARYEQHNNDPNDERYIAFLRQLLTPLLEHEVPGRKALDFGCGPTQALAQCLRAENFQVTSYDPFFFPNHRALRETFDLITASEVVEHFSAPRSSWSRLVPLLNRDGLLGVMTELLPETDAIEDWYYLRDPTHVAFYSKQTFQWIARTFPLELVAMLSRGVIFRQVAMTSGAITS